MERLRTGEEADAGEGAAGVFARSPPRLRPSLGRVVLMHTATTLGGPYGAELQAFSSARKSCVLMRNDANRCVVARSGAPAPPARKNERLLCTHAPSARGRPARAARRSAGRFFYSLLCALVIHSRRASSSRRQRCAMAKSRACHSILKRGLQ